MQSVADRLDILVNNLGIFEPKPFGQISDADWLRIFEVNMLSGIRLARHYVEGMRSRDWGRIVFISSESGIQIPVEMIHYGMTKTAQLAVAPGFTVSSSTTGAHQVLLLRPAKIRADQPFRICQRGLLSCGVLCLFHDGF